MVVMAYGGIAKGRRRVYEDLEILEQAHQCMVSKWVGLLRRALTESSNIM